MSARNNENHSTKGLSKSAPSMADDPSWAKLATELGFEGSLESWNIAYQAIDRNLEKGLGAKTAIRWISKKAHVKDYSYDDLYIATNKFANALKNSGIHAGDGFYVLAPRIPELYISVFGALKHRCIFSPLFAAFGSEPIRARMSLGSCKVLLTTNAIYRRKIQKIKDSLPDLGLVIIADACPEDQYQEPGVAAYSEIMEKADKHYQIEPTHQEDAALLHFTSGTTGKPKGVQHVHGAALYHHLSAQQALDLIFDDVYWCTADPGWVTGTSYGIIAPLTNGVTMVIDEGDFDAERWYSIIENHKVTVWYTAPTAIRMMMRIGEDLVSNYDTDSLRHIASVGEPLNPEAIKWGKKAFNRLIHDNWWQTETGGIMIANVRGLPIKPGSMGKPLPGIKAKIIKKVNDHWLDGQIGEEGELALKGPWPSMFRGYLNQEERYHSSFTTEGWYRSGDLAKADNDGYFWFVGRTDDMIKSAGHLIGPFEVENALLEHPAVAEAGVIGKPDDVVKEVVKAFVTLNPGYDHSQTQVRNIMAHARKRLGPAVAPREIEIVMSLPKTRSGKIMRRLLKARELGLPVGDTSTLEPEQRTRL